MSQHSSHHDQVVHHHHSHADHSQHPSGHHLLQIDSLSIGFKGYDDQSASFFRAKKKEVMIISDLSLSVHKGEIVALIGASGSGKSLLADAIMGLYEPNVTVEGCIWFEGELQNAASLGSLRGKGISFVPQSITYLDPLMKVGRQVQGFKRSSDNHRRKEHEEALFERYSLDRGVADRYPFELSGGMSRRILLMSALMDDPKLIIADEPTPGLNLELAIKAMDDFRQFADAGGGVLLITHDIELALRIADRVAVFKEGTIVEETSVESFENPETLIHPFSKELWHALPEHDFMGAQQ